jgi:hypothetical protein
MNWVLLIRFVHIITTVFMAVPLYSLVIVNERARLGRKVSADVDRYMERMIRGNAKRCYAFQLTVFASGLALLLLGGMGFRAIVENVAIGIKTGAVVVLMVLLSYVHLGLQPRIDALLSGVEGAEIPEDTWQRMASLRLRRKRLAAACLFVLIAAVIFAIQVQVVFPLWANLVLLALNALFVRHAFRSLVTYGWV